MKNTMTTSEAKIAICEKFLKDMRKIYDMEPEPSFYNGKTKDNTCYMLMQVEKMLIELENK